MAPLQFRLGPLAFGDIPYDHLDVLDATHFIFRNTDLAVKLGSILPAAPHFEEVRHHHPRRALADILLDFGAG